jgi:hypothetical protein
MRRLFVVMLSVAVMFSFAGEALAYKKPKSHGCIQKGDGTMKQPYILCTAADFELLHTYPTKYFELGANIKLSDYYSDVHVWRSIPSFTGSLDGNNRTVSDLISRTGLIEENSGIVKNLKLTVNITGFYMTGGIASNNYGFIVNSQVDGRVSGRWDVGAIAGVNYGSILHSRASGSISVDTGGGGLVGINKGTITLSSSSATVVGSYDVGGLVGINQGKIISSSSAGKAVGYASDVGGLVGLNDAAGVIQLSLAVGDVYANLSVPDLHKGKLFGRNLGKVLHSNGYGRLIDINQYVS